MKFLQRLYRWWLLPDKRKEISDEQRKEILHIYLGFQEGEYCKIYDNEFFAYTKMTVERPLIQNGITVTTKSGELKPGSKLKDTERIPLSQDIDEYFEQEVKPHVLDAWKDQGKDKVGCEINFTKYFYQYKPLRSLEKITQDILNLETETEGLLHQIIDK